MMSQALLGTVGVLLADHKGLVVMDESNGTCNARFAKLAVWPSGRLAVHCRRPECRSGSRPQSFRFNVSRSSRGSPGCTVTPLGTTGGEGAVW